MLSISQCKVCHRTTPLGLDEHPVFSWVLESDGQNVYQTAYGVRVCDKESVLWDSGKVESRESLAVSYGGPALSPCTAYRVQVRIWDTCGESAEANTAFETGMLDSTRFTAQWITPPWEKADAPCPVFIKQFDTQKPVQARLYISACGIYQTAINGQSVSQDFFVPGWTNYRQCIQDQTYDVTSLLAEHNVLEITAAPGWYAGYLNGEGQNHFYGDREAVFAELHLWYADGRKRIIPTDESWLVTTGPVQYAEFYHGEHIDHAAQPAPPVPAVIYNKVSRELLMAQQCEPVTIVQ